MGILDYLRSDPTESCDHTWKKDRYYDGLDRIYYGEDGEPFIRREEHIYNECTMCGERDWLDITVRDLYLDVTRHEQVE